MDYIKSAERWQEYGKNYHKDGSIYYAEGNKTALTITTFLIGFIGVFLQLGNVFNGPLLGKILISISLISALISAVSGLLLFRRMNEFLNKAGSYYEKLSENLFLWMFRNKKEYGDEYPKEIYKGLELEPELKTILSDIQLGAIIVAFFTVTIFFLSMLFQNKFISITTKTSYKASSIAVNQNKLDSKTKQIFIKPSLKKSTNVKNNNSVNTINIVLSTVFKDIIKYLLGLVGVFFSGLVGALIALWLNKINNPDLDIIALEDANDELNYGPERPVPGRCKFFRLKIINKPLNKYLSVFFSRETAQQLNAFITFKELGKTMKGRWSGTLELAYTDIYNTIRLANFPEPISLYPGDNTILDVFAKFEAYDHAYGWNNEAYLDNNLWKTEDYKLLPGDYNIEVIIAGTNATTRKKFKIHIDKTIEATSLI
ncbi:MAG: hypothetical protein WC894_04140 [Patescibacteria group bacterium]